MAHRTDWQVMVEEYKRSGMTQSSWCKEKNLVKSTFQYHLKKCSQSAYHPFIELRAPSTGIKLRIGKICLELDAEFDERTLRRFLQAVEEIC